MIKAIAIDDEPLALNVIEKLCNKVEFISLVKTFTEPDEAMKHLRKFPVDLLFLDIKMPAINGINFFKAVKQETMVIFTTAFSEYAVEGFNVNAVDYLLKPIEPKRFVQACERAKEYFQYINNSEGSNSSFLCVRSEYALLKIPFSEILYLETLDDYIKIHQLGKKTVLTIMSMKRMLERLPEKEFIRIHRSFIVPLRKVESVRGKSVSLGVIDLPIGASYEKDFFKKYTEQSF
jgi:DNA-binding LytR/AlgR family response regulator